MLRWYRTIQDDQSSVNLHFRNLGAGRSLVILHGLFGSGDNWRTMGKKLSARFQVCLPDLRNHGDSFHSAEHTYRAMAGDLRNMLDRQGLNQVSLIGHSMGGKTAMTFALESPDRVDRLIIVDTSPSAYGRRHDDLFEALSQLDLASIRSRKEADHLLAERIPRTRERQFVLRSLKRGVDGSYHWKMNMAGLRENYSEILKGIDHPGSYPKPALFVRGGGSSYVDDTHLPEIRRLFPFAEIRTIDKAGHWVHSDAPEAFLEIVLDFLGER
jgi:pimeloyl-ACP methyl ester carboxylesterase